MEEKSDTGKNQTDEMETKEEETEDGGHSFMKKTWLTITLYIGFIVTVRDIIKEV